MYFDEDGKYIHFDSIAKKASDLNVLLEGMRRMSATIRALEERHEAAETRKRNAWMHL
jgi:hypothetical protein